MAFVITDRQIRTYQEGIDAIINQLGKTLILVQPPKQTNCPNCVYDQRRKRSAGRYTSSNPNPLGPLHKPFNNGQVCPVCQGKGLLKSEQSQVEIKATMKWSPNERVTNDEGQQVYLSDDIVKIKTFVSHFDDFNNAIQYLVAYDENVEDSPNLVRCKPYIKAVPRGLKYNRYFIAYLQRIDN